MKSSCRWFAALLLSGVIGSLSIASGHDLATGESHGHYDGSVKPPETVAPVWFLAQANTSPSPASPPLSAAGLKRPLQGSVFELFAPRVSVRWDERYLYVENNGIPVHNMMVGITAWQLKRRDRQV